MLHAAPQPVRPAPSGAAVAGAVLGAGALGAATALAPLAAPAAVGLLAVTAVVLARPDLAVPLAVGLLASDALVVASDVHGAPAPVALAVPALLAVPLVRDLLAGRRLVLDGLLGWMLVLVAVACASAILGRHQDVALGELADLVLQGLVLYVLVVNVIRTPEALRTALWALVVASAGLALVTAVQQLTGRSDSPFGGFAALDVAYLAGFGSSPRATGPLGDPNYYAQILLAPLAIAVVLLRVERGAGARLAAGAAIVLLVAALAWTYSRGAAIAAVVLVGVLVATRVLRGRHVLAVVGAVVLLLAVQPAYRERLVTLGGVTGATAQAGEADAADDSTRKRTTENLAALLAFADHPVLGVGPGAFPSYYQHYAPRVGLEVHEEAKVGPDRGSAPAREAHNLVLGTAADLGLAGLIALGGLLGTAAGGLVRARRRVGASDPRFAAELAGLLAALAGYVVAGMFLSLAFERFLWLLVALAGAAAAITSRGPATGPRR